MPFIATGVRTDGHREVLGVDIGDSENETFWTEFLRDLKDRGLGGVQLVISDAHVGLRAAIRRVFQGAGWQRCRVHATRNLLGHCKHAHRGMVAALIRTIFAQPDRDAAKAQLRAVVAQLESVEPKVAELLEAAEDDLLAYAKFPPVHWPKIWSNNPIERLNRELKRRTDVVQIFPDPESVIRLVGALLCEVNDELVAAPAATWPKPPSPRSPTMRRTVYRPSRPSRPDNRDARSYTTRWDSITPHRRSGSPRRRR